jgi:hypothetical protein
MSKNKKAGQKRYTGRDYCRRRGALDRVAFIVDGDIKVDPGVLPCESDVNVNYITSWNFEHTVSVSLKY